MNQAKARPRIPSHHAYLWSALAIAVAIYLVASQRSTFHKSVEVLAQANWRWVLAAVVVSFGAHLTASLKYQMLALKRLKYWPTLLVQLSALLASRVLPAGIGGMGLNYAYLRRKRHTPSQAAVVVTMNNVLGLVGHGLLLILVVASNNVHWQQVLPAMGGGVLQIIALSVGIMALLLGLLFGNWLRRSVRLVVHDFRLYRKRTLQLLGAVAASVAIAAFYAAALHVSGLALGASFPYTTALVVLTVGVAASSITPTPGGLIGAEAGLVAGLLAYQVPLATAIAVTILYRLVTYWLSLLIGVVALVAAERANII